MNDDNDDDNTDNSNDDEDNENTTTGRPNDTDKLLLIFYTIPGV